LNLGSKGVPSRISSHNAVGSMEEPRAENNILALLYLLSHGLSDGTMILSKLIECSERPTYRVNAVDAPFDAKDWLKARGYRWDAAMRFWWRGVGQDEGDVERARPYSDVHAGYGEPAFIPVSACERH
jgi:DNA polymerase III subunit epsilon